MQGMLCMLCPRGTRISMAAECFGVLWAAQQQVDRCVGTVMAWRSAARQAIYIKWDGDERAAASTLVELDASINRVQLFQHGSWTPRT